MTSAFFGLGFVRPRATIALYEDQVRRYGKWAKDDLETQKLISWYSLQNITIGIVSKDGLGTLCSEYTTAFLAGVSK